MTREKFLLKITEKWPVKILSVAGALIIAIFYRMNTLETRYITIPLAVETNDTLISVSSFAETVRVSLRGEASSINQIIEEDIEAYIDLNRLKSEGTFRIPVQIRKNGTALAVDPLEISVFPMEIRITLEQKESRNIPVFPVFRGTIAQGFEMTNQSIIPAHVIAEGPRSVLDSQYEFITNAIELDGRNENFSILTYIINDNPLITIRGNRMIEYSASVRQIQRVFEIPEWENQEDGDEEE